MHLYIALLLSYLINVMFIWLQQGVNCHLTHNFCFATIFFCTAPERQWKGPHNRQSNRDVSQFLFPGGRPTRPESQLLPKAKTQLRRSRKVESDFFLSSPSFFLYSSTLMINVFVFFTTFFNMFRKQRLSWLIPRITDAFTRNEWEKKSRKCIPDSLPQKYSLNTHTPVF